jgi:hypothetical protein
MNTPNRIQSVAWAATLAIFIPGTSAAQQENAPGALPANAICTNLSPADRILFSDTAAGDYDTIVHGGSADLRFPDGHVQKLAAPITFGEVCAALASDRALRDDLKAQQDGPSHPRLRYIAYKTGEVIADIFVPTRWFHHQSRDPA